MEIRDQISSPQNARIRDLVRLMEKPAHRREAGLMVVEGARELGHALRAGIDLQQLYWCREVTPEAELQQLVSEFGLPLQRITEITRPVLDKIAYRESTEGLIGVAITPALTLDALKLPANPLVIVLEAVEKPGNLGAILRTADGARVDAVIVCDPRTDVFNPNTIRSSVGCVFTVPVAVCTTDEAIAYLRARKIKTWAATLRGEQYYYQQDFTGPTAFVMGTEAHGLSDTWHNAADAWAQIPMRGIIDSLNVGVATAVLVFEAVRQRGGGYVPTLF